MVRFIVAALLIVFTTAITSVTAAWSADIEFDGKNFLDNGEVVGIAGTMKGEGVIYKNKHVCNSVCAIQQRMHCYVD